MRGIRRDWAVGELSTEIMRGPVGENNKVDESLSAYAVFKPVNLAAEALPNTNIARSITFLIVFIIKSTIFHPKRALPLTIYRRLRAIGEL